MILLNKNNIHRAIWHILGFTLIEILLVILVGSILFSLGTSTMQQILLERKINLTVEQLSQILHMGAAVNADYNLWPTTDSADKYVEYMSLKSVTEGGKTRYKSPLGTYYHFNGKEDDGIFSQYGPIFRVCIFMPIDIKVSTARSVMKRIANNLPNANYSENCNMMNPPCPVPDQFEQQKIQADKCLYADMAEMSSAKRGEITVGNIGSLVLPEGSMSEPTTHNENKLAFNGINNGCREGESSVISIDRSSYTLMSFTSSAHPKPEIMPINSNLNFTADPKFGGWDLLVSIFGSVLYIDDPDYDKQLYAVIALGYNPDDAQSRCNMFQYLRLNYTTYCCKAAECWKDVTTDKITPITSSN